MAMGRRRLGGFWTWAVRGGGLHWVRATRIGYGGTNAEPNAIIPPLGVGFIAIKGSGD